MAASANMNLAWLEDTGNLGTNKTIMAKLYLLEPF